MSHPFALDARFAAPLVLADDSLPSATMGTDFRHQLTVNGGIGGDVWELTAGTLPIGLAMSATGLVTGLPEQTGSFPLGVSVSSGSQLVVETLQLNVIAPALAVSDVLQHLVGGGTPLSEQDIVYLDLLGNGNSWLDLGDFLGWVEATGVTMTTEEALQLREVASHSGGSALPARVPGKGRRP
jgi:hypothetical protein